MDSLRFMFFVAGMPFQGDSHGKKALGGSETAGLYMARGLAARGHQVEMFCQCEQPGIYEGVEYRRIDDFPRYAMDTNDPHDVTVIQRVPNPLMVTLASHVQWWWMHDLALRRYVEMVRGVSWNVNAILTVSEWHRQQMLEVYGLEKDLVVATRNGIDLGLIQSVEGPPERDLNSLVYTARPERGMDILLESIFPRLLQARPTLTLTLAGYENYVQELQPLYQKIQMLVARFGGRVRHVGALTKPDLYRLYKSSALYLYPSDFEEVSCITAMEVAACGLPFVASDRAALPETCLPEASLLIPLDEVHQGARNVEYQNRFVTATLDLLNDPARMQAMSAAGIAGAVKYDWAGVAAEWEALALPQVFESRKALGWTDPVPVGG